MSDPDNPAWHEDAPEWVIVWVVVCLLGWALIALLYFGVIAL